ncbi:hypothetical protein HZS_6791 [Henneguya salminicola]|nr:hypothetical protein HZS_6791 [Henneguya salminicola]
MEKNGAENDAANYWFSKNYTHKGGGKIVSVIIPNEEMSFYDYIDSFLAEKSSQLNLSSSKIFQGLILSLRERFVNIPYTFHSNCMIYLTIRNNRGLIKNESDRGSNISSS